MACRHCHKQKIKCVWNPDTNSCESSIKKGLHCTPHHSRQGWRSDLQVDKEDNDVEEEDQRVWSVCGATHLGDSEPKSLCFKSDTKIVQDVYCQGSREIWSVLSEDNTLQRDVLKSRVRMDRHGVSSYLHCTCVSKLRQGATGSFGVFQLKTTDTWHLCVIQSFFYLNHDDTDKVYLLEWTGLVDRDGSPMFYKASSWEDFRHHFTERVFDCGDVNFRFVNKVRGNTFTSVPISDATRSKKDGGIQCNPSGPDTVPSEIVIPVGRKADCNLNLSSLELKGGQPFFLRKKKRKKGNNNIEGAMPQSALSRAWSQPPSRLTPKEANQLSIIVSKSDGSSLTPADTKSLGDAADLLFFPSPLSSDNQQKFFGVTLANYHRVVQEINGITPPAAIAILEKYCKSAHILCNATSLHPDDLSGHSYTKVFISGVASPAVDEEDEAPAVDQAPSIDDQAPSVDEAPDVNQAPAVDEAPDDVDQPPLDDQPSVKHTTNTIHLSGVNRTISLKRTTARVDLEFIPVSVSIVDPCLHGIVLTKGIIKRIALALGDNGLFSKRHRSAHQGSLSYIGQRSYDTCAQPNPSEGDIKLFWYYRNYINQAFWPFVLKVMNYLTTKLLILPQLQFFHLSRMLPVLFPLLFENGDRDFCLFAILTINFLNCIHVDEKDDLGPSVDRDLIEGLQSLLHCPHMNESQKIEIKSSIALIEKYGASSPTTCGYQCISPDNVEIIQFFSCYGLGMCYAVQHFWTHSFLANTFSHYTSKPLFIHDGLVYSKYDDAYIIGWGKGKDRGSYYTSVNGQRVRRSKRNAL